MDLQIEPLKEHAEDVAGTAIGAARAVASIIGDATESLTSDSEKSSKGTSWLLWLVLSVVAFVAIGSVLFKRKRSNDQAIQEVVDDAATGADVPSRPAMAS